MAISAGITSSNGGRTLSLTDSKHGGHDYHSVVYSPVAAGSIVSWSVKWDLLSNGFVGITTCGDDATAPPTERRKGHSIFLQKGGQVYHVSNGKRASVSGKGKFSGMKTGDVMHLTMDASAGRWTARRNDSAECIEFTQVDEGDKPRLSGYTWYPIVVFDNPDETATVDFGASAAAAASSSPPAAAASADPAATSALARALGSGRGVPWRQARVMVRGVGGVGKSSTIDAMAGKEFDAQHKSTVGAGVEELELVRQDLVIGAAGGALRPYVRADDLDEYALALAAHAAALIDAPGAASEQQAGLSMLGAIEKPKARVPQAPRVPPAPTAPTSGVGLSAARAAEPAAHADAAASHSVAQAAAAEQAKPPAAAAAQHAPPERHGAPTPAATAAGAAPGEVAPAVSPELVIKFKKGELQSNLVLRVQDTGGQPIFLSILELLTTPAGTVYMVVFSLAKLQVPMPSSNACVASAGPRAVLNLGPP